MVNCNNIVIIFVLSSCKMSSKSDEAVMEMRVTELPLLLLLILKDACSFLR